MAERRGSRRQPARRDPGDDIRDSAPKRAADPDDQSPLIPVPTRPPISFRGRALSPGHVIELFREGLTTRQNSRRRILDVRALRRNEPDSLIRLAPNWVRRNPEAASWVAQPLPERQTLEGDLIARIGAVEGEFDCEPLGFEDSDIDAAEEKEGYLEEWRQRHFPAQTCFGKGTEDGEYGMVVIPANLDMDGAPDFFEYLDERAYESLPDGDRKSYAKDDEDRRGRYVKQDKDGKKAVNPKFDRGDRKKSEEAHEKAVQRYLLGQRAEHVRIIPALDCVPIFTRSTSKGRWECIALIERTLYYQEELIEAGYGWEGLGNRQLVPLAYKADGSALRVDGNEVGHNGQFYLYTAYVMCRDDRGCTRPVIAWTVGGASTWDATSGDPSDRESVGLIDLYDEYKAKDGTCVLDVPMWGYFGGLHTEDDDPDHYWRPYMYPFLGVLKSIEGNKTSINAHVATNAFPGYYYTPDGKLAEFAPEAVIEKDGELIVPGFPGTAEIKPSGGAVTPAVSATISADAWRQLDSDKAWLRENTAVDQIQTGSSTSGRAQVVQSGLAQVAKRHIRDGERDALVFAGERALRIWHAIYAKWKVRWPIQTVDERPVGTEIRTGVDVLEYDPSWIGEGNFNLKADFPAEENLARRDLEMNAYERKLGTLKRVAESMGEKDTMALRREIVKDQLWAAPETVMAMQERLAKQSGNRELQKIIRLRNAQLAAQQDVPGVGVMPMAALRRQGEQKATGGGGPSIAASMRGGQEASEMATASQNADDAALLAVGA